jgi:crotonobetainyl-CoA:carnitine CoA-transferase CaiB-like acyl-CoA transferase
MPHARNDAFPALGAHSREVLDQLGYTNEEIAAFLHSGAVEQAPVSTQAEVAS